jgi:RNA polymerase sigma factor (sigma-70 family)
MAPKEVTAGPGLRSHPSNAFRACRACLDRREIQELTMWVSIGESSAFPAALWMVETRDKILSGSAAVAIAAPAPGAAATGDLDGIMERCATGDDRAFDELYRRGAQRVRGFLIRLSGNASLADDLTQETFVRIHRARGSFAVGAAALPWMFAIARNAFLDHARRENVRRSSGARIAQPREAPKDTQGDEVFSAREMLDIVRETLERRAPAHAAARRVRAHPVRGAQRERSGADPRRHRGRGEGPRVSRLRGAARGPRAWERRARRTTCTTHWSA